MFAFFCVFVQILLIFRIEKERLNLVQTKLHCFWTISETVAQQIQKCLGTVARWDFKLTSRPRYFVEPQSRNKVSENLITHWAAIQICFAGVVPDFETIVRVSVDMGNTIQSCWQHDLSTSSAGLCARLRGSCKHCAIKYRKIHVP